MTLVVGRPLAADFLVAGVPWAEPALLVRCCEGTGLLAVEPAPRAAQGCAGSSCPLLRAETCVDTRSVALSLCLSFGHNFPLLLPNVPKLLQLEGTRNYSSTGPRTKLIHTVSAAWRHTARAIAALEAAARGVRMWLSM